MYNNQFNQYQQPQMNQWYQPPLQKQEIVKVNGENGAMSYQIAPNSNALLLDSQAPIVWFVQTDGAGYKTVTPYTITPYQVKKQSDLNDLEMRIAKLEEMFNNEKSNITTNVKRGKSTTTTSNTSNE